MKKRRQLQLSAMKEKHSGTPSKSGKQLCHWWPHSSQMVASGQRTEAGKSFDVTSRKPMARPRLHADADADADSFVVAHTSVKILVGCLTAHSASFMQQYTWITLLVQVSMHALWSSL